MKFKFILISALVTICLFPTVSLGASYPATCPVEAQGVLTALGGCGVVDCSLYGAICSKCGCSSKSQESVSTVKKQTPSVVLPSAKSQTLISSSTTNSGSSIAVSSFIIITSLVLGLIFWGAVWYVIWSLLKRTKPERWIYQHSVLMSIIILAIIFIIFAGLFCGLISFLAVTH